MRKTKKIIYLSLALIFITVFFIELPVSTKKIVGVYVNNNAGRERFYAEIPYMQDTLKLNSDLTFSSFYFNNGTYQIESGFFKNQLTLHYRIDEVIPKSILEHSDPNYDGSIKTFSENARQKFNVRNKLFRPLKIDLVRDLNYYYHKAQ